MDVSYITYTYIFDSFANNKCQDQSRVAICSSCTQITSLKAPVELKGEIFSEKNADI